MKLRALRKPQESKTKSYVGLFSFVAIAGMSAVGMGSYLYVNNQTSQVSEASLQATAPCEYLQSNEECLFDTRVVENGVESITLPDGSLWKYSENTKIATSTDLATDTRYNIPGAPCDGKDEGECRFDTRTFYNDLESITTPDGKLWNYDSTNTTWNKLDLLTDGHYHSTGGPCEGKTAGQCRFDTRTFYDDIESITTSDGKYWDYDTTKTTWSGGDLVTDGHYVDTVNGGVCNGKAEGKCVFSSRTFTDNFEEITTIDGKFFHYDISTKLLILTGNVKGSEWYGASDVSGSTGSKDNIKWEAGDFDSDEDVDLKDFSSFAKTYQNKDLKADLDKDGETRITDFILFADTYKEYDEYANGKITPKSSELSKDFGTVVSNPYIKVFAAGTQVDNVYPEFDVLFGGEVLETITDVRGDPVAGNYIEYKIDTTDLVDPSRVWIEYTNDVGLRDLYVDKIEVGDDSLSDTYETEADDTLFYFKKSGCNTGYLKSEKIACSGRILYKVDYTYVSVFAKGTPAENNIYPNVELKLRDKVVRTYDNVKSWGGAQDKFIILSYYNGTPFTASDLQVHFVNDYKAGGNDRNLQVEKMIVGNNAGVKTYLTGDAKTYEYQEGSCASGSGCGTNDMLGCNGYFEFDSNECTAATAATATATATTVTATATTVSGSCGGINEACSIDADCCVGNVCDANSKCKDSGSV